MSNLHRGAEDSSVVAHELRMEAVMAQYESALLRYTTRILNNGSTAEDVVQNTFIKLFRLWTKEQPEEKQLKAWLYRVAHNEAVDHIRRESRLKLLHDRQAEDPAAGDCRDGVHCPKPEDDRKQRVLRHLNRLHEREQQVVLLRLEEGLSYDEIAEITGRSSGNVGNILHHAVKKLSEIMKKEDAMRV